VPETLAVLALVAALVIFGALATLATLVASIAFDLWHREDVVHDGWPEETWTITEDQQP
jgi:hypothetical protein